MMVFYLGENSHPPGFALGTSPCSLALGEHLADDQGLRPPALRLPATPEEPRATTLETEFPARGAPRSPHPGSAGLGVLRPREASTSLCPVNSPAPQILVYVCMCACGCAWLYTPARRSHGFAQGGPLGQLTVGVGAFLSGLALTTLFRSPDKAAGVPRPRPLRAAAADAAPGVRAHLPTCACIPFSCLIGFYICGFSISFG